MSTETLSREHSQQTNENQNTPEGQNSDASTLSKNKQKSSHSTDHVVFTETVKILQSLEQNTHDNQTPSSSTDPVVCAEIVAYLRSLEQEMKSLPEIDYDRVAAIKEKIAQGTLKIDSDQLAKSIMKGVRP